MANTNILNNIPFGDTNLKSTVTSLQRETPEVTYYIATAEVANPTTDDTELLTYEIVYPIDRPFELSIEANVYVESALAGDQEFTFTLYNEDGAEAIVALTADVPDANNDAVAFKFSLVARASDSRTAPTSSFYTAKLEVLSLEGSSIANIVLPDPVAASYAFPRNLTFLVTAETGTATTTVSLLSAKVTLDRQVWN